MWNGGQGELGNSVQFQGRKRCIALISFAVHTESFSPVERRYISVISVVSFEGVAHHESDLKTLLDEV